MYLKVHTFRVVINKSIFYLCSFYLFFVVLQFCTQCSISWVGTENQAQQEIYVEIHQHNPINHANSRNINNDKARKLKIMLEVRKMPELNFARKQPSCFKQLKILLQTFG